MVTTVSRTRLLKYNGRVKVILVNVVRAAQSLLLWVPRFRAPWSSSRVGTRALVINSFAEVRNPPIRYLEIGLNRGKTFDAVLADSKVGVDPRTGFFRKNLGGKEEVYKLTSDKFFSHLPAQKFDLIFVDGLHEYLQCYRDVLNSLNYLEVGGVILVDDVRPESPTSAKKSQKEAMRDYAKMGRVNGPWHGDVYKLVEILKHLHPELNYRTLSRSGHSILALWPTREGRRSYNLDIQEKIASSLEILDVSAAREGDFQGILKRIPFQASSVRETLALLASQ